VQEFECVKNGGVAGISRREAHYFPIVQMDG